MKDLTHYFASPKKSVERIEGSKNLADSKERAEILGNDVVRDEKGRIKTDTTVTTSTARIEEEVTPEEESGTTRVEKKRSRVKIRISLKDSEENNRCDIIESKNDFVDKTPSPFKKRCSKSDEGAMMISENEALTRREETSNAFQLLMTRNKNSTTSTAPSRSAAEISSSECERAKLKRNQEKLTVLAERKEYPKRKHAEIEEAGLMEKRFKKRAKLLRKGEEKTGEQQISKKIKLKKTKKKKKGDPPALGSNRKETVGKTCDNHLENNNERERNEKNEETEMTESRKSLADGREAFKSISRAKDCSDFLRKQQTPKCKPKWAMRVKLQSHSEDDCDDERGGDDEGDSSDECIFTPKSRMKFQRRTSKMNSKGNNKEGNNKEGNNKEGKSPGDERGETAIADSHDFLKRGKHRARKTKLQISEVIHLEDKILDKNITEIEEGPIILQEKKLAPLFVRRSKPNPAAVEARRNFLQSGIPEAVKKIISDQKPSCNDAGTSTMPFPKISHVSQSRDEEESTGSGSAAFYKQKSGLREQVAALAMDFNSFKSLSNSSSESGKREEEKVGKIERENLETVLQEVETRCSDARKIWETVSFAASNRGGSKKSPKKHIKKLKLQKKTDAVIFREEENLDNLNPTWICKYKPMSSVQVVGNERAIDKLRNWLSGWRLPSPKDERSSGDEFYSSDCSISSYYENNQVAVLIGPHGSGKTASVYAIAEELGYRVLEVNASSRRTGKRIMTDFQEATKSHRVKRNQGTLVSTTVKKPSEKRVPQNSLIFIEDVDLIFEEDEGFVSAIFQLATNTRRPIVMTCKEACAHLNKMAPQQQIIHFQTATGNRVAALLELIALAESGYRLPRYCSDILLRKGDLRQSLLQLQYILLSGPPSLSQLGTNRSLITWSDMQPLIYKPAIKSSRKTRKEFSDVKLRANEDKKLADSLAKKLDTISLISSLTDVENPASPPWRRKLNPSLSLLEDLKPYSNSADLGAEIAAWLRCASIGSEDANDAACESNSASKAQLAIKRKVKLGIDRALAQAMPSTLEHRSTSTDYLPVIRTMCRSEQERASINTKRGNRFHNYLHGLNLASASSNILAAASSVFKDKYV